MLIQKTIHLRMARDEAKARLSDTGRSCRHFADVETLAVGTDGIMHLKFGLPCGPFKFWGTADLLALESEDPDQTLFRSCRGNVDVVGTVEYFEIKPNLTEIVLTVDYTIVSRVMRAIDFLLNSVDRFLNRELRRLEACFARPGARSPTYPDFGRSLDGHPAPGKPV